MKCTCKARSATAPVHSATCEVNIERSKNALMYLYLMAEKQPKRLFHYVAISESSAAVAFEKFKRLLAGDFLLTVEGYMGRRVVMKNLSEVVFTTSELLESLNKPSNGVVLEDGAELPARVVPLKRVSPYTYEILSS
jgi:hypothetical protein